MAEQLCLPGFDHGPSPQHNLYFAVRPSPAAGTGAARVAWALCDRHGVRGRRVDPARMHISLLGFGRHPWPRSELVDWMRRAATVVNLPRFAVRLDRIATFAGPRARLPIVLLERQAIAELALLRATLGAAVTGVGIDAWLRSRYEPHLTLLYGERPVPAQPVAAIGWPVREFVLVYRRDRTSCETLGRWPLRA